MLLVRALKPLRRTLLPLLAASPLLVAPNAWAASSPSDNLAYLRPVTASSSAGFNVPARVVDYRYSTNWEAATPGDGQWLTVDLEAPREISGVEFRFNNATHVRGYVVEVSADGIVWTPVVEAERQPTQIRYHAFSATGRYVRWTLTSIATSTANPEPATVQVSEFFVLGPPVNPLPPLPRVSDPAPPYISTGFVRGADVSHLMQNEHYGARYFDEHGVEKDPLEIMRDRGVNTIRIKVWNDPGNRAHDPARLHDPLGFNNPYWATRLAVRARELGFRIMIDFHYSDTWADPGKQYIPHEWLGLSAEEVALRLYDFTYDTLSLMKEHGVVPEWVQVGNEIRAGILWPLGRYWDAANGGSWTNYAMFLTSGAQAVKDVDPSIKVVMHHDESGRINNTTWFYDQLVARNIPFDVIGLSYYPRWHGTLSAMTNSVWQLSARFNKPVILVETAHPWTTENFDDSGNILSIPDGFPYPISVDGQSGFLDDIVLRVKSAPNDLGQGIIYWEATWTALTGLQPVQTSTAGGGAGWAMGEGNAWESNALFGQFGQELASLAALGNLPPVVNAGPSAVILKGATFSSAGSFTDADAHLSFSATVDYGDGSGVQTLTLNADKTFSLSHSYAAVGEHEVTVSVTDDEGRTGIATTTVHVVYEFGGFLPPIAGGSATNQAQAGGVVPVKFSLTGDQGLAIFAAGYPKSVRIGAGGAEGDPQPAASAGGSGLSYNAATDQYVFAWKTDRAWRGTTRQLVLQFDDGTTHTAVFNFR
jgi:arabinogalactan endo-1,4-beta-galactosidase